MPNPEFAHRLTVSTLSAPAWPLAKIIEQSAACGLNGIDFRGLGPELDVTQLDEFNAGLPQTLRSMQERGLEIPCLNSSVTLVTAAVTRWEAMLAEYRRYAQLAQKSGTRFIRIFGGAVPAGMVRQEARELAVSQLRALVEICLPLGCKPLLETHDDWSTSAHVLEIVQHFEPSEVGVLWDIEHPWREGESPLQTVLALKGRIEHVHVKDTIRQQGKSRPMLLGEGEIPLSDCLKQLNHINYRGWICLECEKRWHSDGPEPEQSIPQFAKYIRAF